MGDWAREQAREIAKAVDCWLYRGGEDLVANAYAAAFRKQQALARKHEEQVVKAERERVLARLREPDDAMIEAVADYIYGTARSPQCRRQTINIIDFIAAFLSSPTQEEG